MTAAGWQTRGGFGRLLVGLRLRAGLSQEALAHTAGLSVRAVSDLERGRARGPHPGQGQSQASTTRSSRSTTRTAAESVGMLRKQG